MMDEQQIFFEAFELSDPLEQRAFLDKACAGDDQLRARVERLLQASQTRESFMEEPLSLLAGSAANGEVTADFDIADSDLGNRQLPRLEGEYAVGTIIGPYKLLQKLGEGGMGSVFLAEQKEPVKRRVALKVIKEGMKSQAILSRFEAERQALSLMDHPNIARVLDAGETLSGKPYFVMELVKGVPINGYCDAHRLSMRQRLELFKPICQAVQHAHQKGIVHRDIKPSNVLVAEYDEMAMPKVIDFGIAKALVEPLTESTPYTQIGQIVGTLDYMSPEQAKLNELDVDTRSDIYSLGVLLYEILTGSTPYDRQRLRRAALDELVRIIQDETPPLPSQRLSSSETLPEIAASRATSPARLSSLMRGDLDWIVMKALEKDRSRRYQTCAGLVEDIDRYLSNQPVSACPPSKYYLLTKFVRRNKVLAIAGGLVFLSMVLAIVASSWGLYHSTLARAAEQKKVELERQSKIAALAAKQEAEAITAQKIQALEREKQQRSYAEAITRFVSDDFLALTSVEGQLRFGDAATTPLGKDATLQDLLERAAAKLDARKNLAPLTVATLRWMIGVNYRGMGLYDEAARHLKQSSALFSEALGDEHAETLRSRNEWALAELKCGNRDQAISMLQAILTIQHRLGPSGGDSVLVTMNNLASALQENSQIPAAIELFEKIVAAQAHLPEENLDRLRSQNNLADCYRAAGRTKDAIQLHETTYALRKQHLPASDPRVIQSLANLATCYLIDGQMDKALPLHEEAVERMKATLETAHPDLLVIKNNLAIGFLIAGRYTQASQLHQQVYEARRRQLGEKDPSTLTSLSNLAESYRMSGNFQQALKLHEEALAGRREVLPAQHEDIARSLSNLANCCAIDERYLQAMELYKQCLDLLKSIFSDTNHPDTLSAANNLALCQAKLGRYEQAIEILKGIVETRTATAPQHPLTLSSMHNLAECQISKGDFERGLELLNRTLDLRIQNLPPGHPDILESEALLGKTECDQGNVVAGLERMKRVADRVKEFPTVWSVRDEIRSVMLKQNMRDPLSEQIAADVLLARQVLQNDELQLALALAAIAKDMLAIDRFAPALELVEESLQLNQKHAPKHPRVAAVESLKARALIDQAEAGQVEDRNVGLRLAERRLDACYRIQTARVKLTPTLETYEQLAYTVDQLVRVTGLLGANDRQQPWQSVQRAIASARKEFGK